MKKCEKELKYVKIVINVIRKNLIKLAKNKEGIDMKPGENFEIRCYEYLKRLYSKNSISFEREGGMDSTKSDIAVLKNGTLNFYIEAKDNAAQSGQFVLLPDEETKSFIFSPRNHSEPNEMTDIMIDYMNTDFDRFHRAGTAGEALNIDSSIFCDWIIEHYEEKNVKYVISQKNDFVIFPIRRFSNYFDVLAKYRIKKSGSREPAAKDIPAVKEAIQAFYPSVRFSRQGKKLFAVLDCNLTKKRFVLGKYTYYFSEQSEGFYEIRCLSNTYNMNVIFSIQLKKSQEQSDLDEFEADL